MDRFAAALEGAHEAFASHGKRPSWRRFAQVATLIYDEIGDPGLPEKSPPDQAPGLPAGFDKP